MMLKGLIAWWNAPPFRERVLAAIKEFDFDPTAYQIAQRLNPKWPSSGRLYPVLMELEHEGIVESQWLDDAGSYPRRRIYRIKEWWG